MAKQTDWIQLVSGTPFWPLEPDVELIDVHDIAHALSMQCRFAGHVIRFYSVAEHSIHISRAVPAADALWGLLHDATEAYLVDLPRPIKAFMPQYNEAEERLHIAVAQRFGLSMPLPATVKSADTRILMNEKDLLKPSVVPWTWSAEPLSNVTIQCWSPEEAKARFLRRYAELTDQTADR